MGWLFDRRMQAANPYASNPSTKDREKAARKTAKEGRRTGGSRRSIRKAAAQGQAWETAERERETGRREHRGR